MQDFAHRADRHRTRMLLAGSSSTSESVELAAAAKASAPAAELALSDDAPIEQLMLAVFEELHLTEVCGGTQPQAAAAFFARKGLSRVGQLRKSRANQRLKIQLDELARQLLKRAPLDVRCCHNACPAKRPTARSSNVRRAKLQRSSSARCVMRSGGSSIGSHGVPSRRSTSRRR